LFDVARRIELEARRSEAASKAEPKEMKTDVPITVNRSKGAVRVIETGPTVTTPSRLRWKANGLDLLLVNAKAFDKKIFASLLEEFEKTVAGRQDFHLIIHLKTLCSNPRLRWPVELYSSLLRWAATADQKNAALRAKSIWVYLFGSPLPNWNRWEEKTGTYTLHPRAWKTWYDSLAHK
jgi:hypothetical protein